MSYLTKTVYNYWDFDEAIAAKRAEKGNCSLESALDALKSELEFYNNDKANKWKRDWNTMKNNYLAQLSPPTTESCQTSSSGPSNYATSSAISIGSINHSVNSFKGSVYNTPTPQSSRKKSIQPQNNDNQPFDMNYKRVPPTDSLVIDGKVILEKWIEYQVIVAKKYHQTSLLVETDAQDILALDNILLLKKDQICKDMKNILGIDMIQSLEKHIQKKYRIESETLDANLERELKLIVKKFGEKKLGSRQASRCIMSLTSENIDTAVDDILIGVRNLTERLPLNKFTEKIKERTLCGTYVDSIFRPIIEDTDSGKQFSWCDIQINNSIQRPDFVGRVLNNVVWNGPVTVGEVKGEDAKDNIYATLLDLIRIGRFSKQSIDINFYEGVIGIHVVGLTATVYYTCLIDSGLYVMIEICTISMPRDATQLRLYVATCEDLLTVHHLYKNHCQLAKDVDSLKSNMRAGMSEEVFREFASSTKNRKRPCSFTVNQ